MHRVRREEHLRARPAEPAAQRGGEHEHEAEDRARAVAQGGAAILDRGRRRVGGVGGAGRCGAGLGVVLHVGERQRAAQQPQRRVVVAARASSGVMDASAMPTTIAAITSTVDGRSRCSPYQTEKSRIQIGTALLTIV